MKRLMPGDFLVPVLLALLPAVTAAASEVPSSGDCLRYFSGDVTTEGTENQDPRERYICGIRKIYRDMGYRDPMLANKMKAIAAEVPPAGIPKDPPPTLIHDLHQNDMENHNTSDIINGFRVFVGDNIKDQWAKDNLINMADKALASVQNTHKTQANSNFSGGNFLGAQPHASQYVKNAPDNSGANALMAKIFMGLDKPEPAEKFATKAIDLDNTNVDALNTRATARLAQGKQAGALADAQRAGVLDPLNLSLIHI